MTTSRTGTATWKAARTKALRQAQRDGITNCPKCGTGLDYERGGYPESAEVDHATPHSRGGSDHPDNLQVMCRTCNRRKGNRLERDKHAPTPPGDQPPRFPHSRTW